MIGNCGAAALLIRVSKEYFTSSAVTGLPSLKRALGLMRKVADRPSAATLMSSASRPYTVAGSSQLDVPSDSNIMATAAGEVPLRVKGLNLSKLLRRSGLAR